MKGIIFVLGNTNSSEGILSEIARNRLQMGVSLYKQHPSFYLLCTGGFGEHFNITEHPHALYAQRYLMEQGIEEHKILEPVLSRNTIEDACLAKSVLDQYQPQEIIVISSDFHITRVKYLFEYFLPTHTIQFMAASPNISDQERQLLIDHEVNALKRLQMIYPVNSK